jgi:hypothetical protein
MPPALPGCVPGRPVVGLEPATNVCEVSAAEAVEQVSVVAVRPTADGVIACERARQKVE